MLWKWKLARDLDDVLHMLNGETRYDLPAPDARVCMTWRGDHPQFWVFATKAVAAHEPHDGLGDWSWKVVTQPDDVLRFLNDDAPGSRPVGQVQIAAAWAGDQHRFYILYREAPATLEGAAQAGGWALTRADDPAGALTVLNGTAGSSPVSTGRVAAAHHHGQDQDHEQGDFFVFHQPAVVADPVGLWSRQTVGSADQVRAAVEHTRGRPGDFQVAGPAAGNGRFQVFTSPQAGAGNSAALAGARSSAG